MDKRESPKFTDCPLARLDPKQVESFEELLMSQIVQQEALTRLPVEKGILTKKEFWEMVRVEDREMKRKKRKL